MMKTEKILFLSVIGIKIVLVLAVFFLFGQDRFIWADSQHYASMGRNIFLGNGLSFPSDNAVGFESTTEFMPLYPLLLGFFEAYVPHGFVFVSLLQAVAAGGVALFVFRIARVFLPLAAAVAVVCVVSFEPLISAMHILIMPETLFVFFTTAFLYFFVSHLQEYRISDMYKAVLMLILAVYTKPAAMYLLVFAVLFLLVMKGGFRKAAVFVSIFFLAMMPWMMRNHAITGRYVINTNATHNICNWGLSSILAVKYGVDASNWNTTVYLPEYVAMKTRCASTVGALRLFATEYPFYFPATLALSASSILTNDGYTVFFEKSADDQVKIHHNYLTPAVFANENWMQKITAAMKEFSSLELFIIFSAKIFWLVVSLLAFIGLYKKARDRQTRLSALLLLLVIVYFVGASSLAAGISAGARYRYQIDALLLIFAFAGILSYFESSQVMLRRFPITKIKIAIARLLYRIVRLVYRTDKRIIKRNGIVYELDLSEGIDLSVFLFGSFQKHVFQNQYYCFKGDEIIFDIGANAGVMSLQFAKLAPRGAVYSFEPTHYAFAKLNKNISLNPDFASRITTVQAFVSSKEEQDAPITAYASWKVDGTHSMGDHAIHLGTPKDTIGVASTTIDAYIRENHIMRLDFIKIDTDGHEWDVLQGARHSIGAFRPVVVFEVGEYVMTERGITFADYYEFFNSKGYDLFDSNRNGKIDMETYKHYIPSLGAIDVIAVPQKK